MARLCTGYAGHPSWRRICHALFEERSACETHDHNSESRAQTSERHQVCLMIGIDRMPISIGYIARHEHVPKTVANIIMGLTDAGHLTRFTSPKLTAPEKP